MKIAYVATFFVQLPCNYLILFVEIPILLSCLPIVNRKYAIYTYYIVN